MPMDRFLIAPLNSGLTRNSPPWLQPDDAFEYLQNAYIWRQRVKKRYGSELMGTTQLESRLRVSLGNNTNAAMALPANTVSHTPQLAIGQMFSLGTDIFTVYQLGAGVATFTTNPLVTAVINSVAAPNTITITGGALLTPVYWYPSLPVMGTDQYLIGAVNDHPTYAFDTQFAYIFIVGTGWVRSGTAVWKGTDLNFFWLANWQNLAGTNYLFVTNFNFTVTVPATTDDPIWYFDGTTWTAATGATAFYFRPSGGAIHTGPYVKTARIIVPFKNRLVLLNTVENDNSGGAGVNTNYVARARYSFYGSPLARNAWYEKNQQDDGLAPIVTDGSNIASGAGFVDAATEEQIVSAEFTKDRLIVYFERSTWELVYTSNQVLPFVWQKINTELGSMSTFSTIAFDKDVLTTGQSGVHACNGQNVIRIDDKIPDKIFEFETDNNSNQRTVGIRDYLTELAYWTYVEDLHAPVTQRYPNQIMVYNYKNGSWSFNDDCATMFGYFEQTTDKTWASSFPITWSKANYSWISSLIQGNQRQIVFGNQEGWMILINPEESRNAPSLQITNMSFAATGIITLTIINHNLTSQPVEFAFDNDFILIENVVGDAPTMAYLNNSIFNVDSIIDKDTITIDTNNREDIQSNQIAPLFAGTYNGGGTAARVSNIQIKSKDWNPYVDKDRSFYLAKIDFAVVATENAVDINNIEIPLSGGQITVDYYPSASNVPMIQEGVNSGSIMGNSILETTPYDPIIYPFEKYQDLLWHPVYFQTVGTFIQIGMSFSLRQMTQPTIALAYFEIQALALYTTPTSARLE